MRRLSILFFVALTVVGSNGFAVVPKHAKSSLLSSSSSSSSPRLRMSDMDDNSAPSDTSTDNDSVIITTTAHPFDDATTTESEALVNTVLNQLPTALTDVSSETRTAINEALLKLEALNNPTTTMDNPTMSPLVNGVWELRYAGGYDPEWALPSPTRQLALFLYSGGYSPGLFALSLANQLPSALVSVGDLEISISRDQPRIEAKVMVKLFNGSLENEVSVKARLEIESGVRMRETYESATVFGESVDLPRQLQYSRDLYVTYVDEDLLVVRDGSGVPEILVRKQKQFSQNWGIEPETMSDMTAPGEEGDDTLPATD